MNIIQSTFYTWNFTRDDFRQCLRQFLERKEKNCRKLARKSINKNINVLEKYTNKIYRSLRKYGTNVHQKPRPNSREQIQKIKQKPFLNQ